MSDDVHRSAKSDLKILFLVPAICPRTPRCLENWLYHTSQFGTVLVELIVGKVAEVSMKVIRPEEVRHSSKRKQGTSKDRFQYNKHGAD